MLLPEGKVITNASLKNQCYKDYFYGKDLGLEESFSGEESLVASYTLNDNIEKLNGLTSEQLHIVARFVHYQRIRTHALAEQLNSMGEAYVKHLCQPRADAEGVDISRVKVKFPDPQIFAIFKAAALVPLLYDLKIKFLIPNCTLGLILSDHPVISYNQWAENHPKYRKYRGISGFVYKGLQLFLPISPSLCIALYDPKTYEYGSKKTITGKIGKKDVIRLNKIQTINALNNIYIGDLENQEDHIPLYLKERNQHISIHKIDFRAGDLFERPDGKYTQKIVSGPSDIRIKAKFSFVRTIGENDPGPGISPTLPYRSPDLVKFSEGYEKYLRKKLFDDDNIDDN